MDPADTPSVTGTSSLPERADAAQRSLAEIWGTPGDSPEAAEATADAPESAALSLDRDSEPTRARRQALARTGTDIPSRRRERIGELGEELTRCTDAPGPDAPETIDALLALACAHLEVGSAADAIPLLEQALAAAESGDDRTRGAAPKAALAGAYLRVRRPDRAIELYESLLAGEPAPPSRSEALGYRIGLATAHRAAGEASVAIGQLETLARELEAAGAATDVLLGALVELATTHVVAGSPRVAVELYDRALPLAVALRGADDRATFKVRLQLARAHQQTGARAQAIALQEQLVADLERALGPDDALVTQATAELAILLRAR